MGLGLLDYQTKPGQAGRPEPAPGAAAETPSQPQRRLPGVADVLKGILGR